MKQNIAIEIADHVAGILLCKRCKSGGTIC